MALHFAAFYGCWCRPCAELYYCHLPPLSQVRYAILDEADQMLDMGFEEDMEKILSYVPEKASACTCACLCWCRRYCLP